MDHREDEAPTQTHPEELWKKSVDFSLLDDDEFRDPVMKVLEDREKVFEGKLELIGPTDHRIELESGTKHMRKAPNPARRAKRE